MAIFNSYVSLPEGTQFHPVINQTFPFYLMAMSKGIAHFHPVSDRPISEGNLSRGATLQFPGGRVCVEPLPSTDVSGIFFRPAGRR